MKSIKKMLHVIEWILQSQIWKYALLSFDCTNVNYVAFTTNFAISCNFSIRNRHIQQQQQLNNCTEKSKCALLNTNSSTQTPPQREFIPNCANETDVDGYSINWFFFLLFVACSYARALCVHNLSFINHWNTCFIC